MRRLPVFLLLDTSGSMKGEPMEAAKVGLEAMLSALRSDPFALESAWICLIAFDRDARCLVPLTPLADFRLPPIQVPDSGPTHTGQALKLLCEIVDQEIIRGSQEQKGDWKPLLFLMTDGKPSDIALYQEMAAKIRQKGFAAIVPCAAGMKARIEPLMLLSDQAYSLQTMGQADFVKFFQWVSDTIKSGGRGSVSCGQLDLPPPPDEVIVFG